MLVIIFFIAAISLASNLYCWKDIKNGRPHIISLRQITLIMDRNVLNRYFGPPETGYYYTLPDEALHRLIRACRVRIYWEAAADLVCMLGAWRTMAGVASPAFSTWFLLAAALCQGINIAFSVWLVYKWGWQIREELGE